MFWVIYCPQRVLLPAKQASTTRHGRSSRGHYPSWLKRSRAPARVTAGRVIKHAGTCACTRVRVSSCPLAVLYVATLNSPSYPLLITLMCRNPYSHPSKLHATSCLPISIPVHPNQLLRHTYVLHLPLTLSNNIRVIHCSLLCRPTAQFSPVPAKPHAVLCLPIQRLNLLVLTCHSMLLAMLLLFAIVTCLMPICFPYILLTLFCSDLHTSYNGKSLDCHT